MPEDEPMVGLSKLILGCSYCVQKQYDYGIANLRKCLELRKTIPSNASDAHISAFCQYELAALLVKNCQVSNHLYYFFGDIDII